MNLMMIHYTIKPEQKPIYQKTLIIDILTMARTIQTSRRSTAQLISNRSKPSSSVRPSRITVVSTVTPKKKAPLKTTIKKKTIQKPFIKQRKLSKITKLKINSSIQRPSRYSLRKREQGEKGSVVEKEKMKKKMKVLERVTRKRSEELKKKDKKSQSDKNKQKKKEKQQNSQKNGFKTDSKTIISDIKRINRLCELQLLFSKLMRNQKNQKALQKARLETKARNETRAFNEKSNDIEENIMQELSKVRPPPAKRRYKKGRGQLRTKGTQTIEYCEQQEQPEKKQKQKRQERDQEGLLIRLDEQKEEYIMKPRKLQLEENKQKAVDMKQITLKPILIDESQNIQVIKVDISEENQQIKDIKSNLNSSVLMYLISFTKSEDLWSFNLVNKKKKLFIVKIAKQSSCSCNKGKSVCPHLQFVLMNIAKCPQVYKQIKQVSLTIKQNMFNYVATALQIALYSRMDPQVKSKPRKNINELCLICFNNFCKTQTTTVCDCSSLFHSKCLSIWRFIQNEQCPTCKIQHPYRTPSPEKKHDELLDQLIADSD